MRNRLWSAVTVATLAGALVLLLPGISEAQRRGSGFYGGRGGYGGYGGYGGLGYGGYGGLGYGGYGYGGYGYGLGGMGLNYGRYGYGGYGSGYGYGGYGSGYGNYATITPYANYGYGSADYAYNPQTVTNQSFYPPVNSANNNGAHIRVVVPPDAEVWFDGQATQQRGQFREFETPTLDPNRSFTYTVRARWNQNGQVMDQTRSLQVQGGRMATLDFLQGQQQPQQQQQPQVQQPQQDQAPRLQQKAPPVAPPQKVQQPIQ